MLRKFNMQHIIVCVVVGVLLQWNHVEARPTTKELAERYAELHPNTRYTADCNELEDAGSDKKINPLNAVEDESLKWPKNEVPYSIIRRDFTRSQIEQIEAGLVELEKLTSVNGAQCVKIVPHTTQEDYISIYRGYGCSSYVGRIGGKQSLSVYDGCYSKGTIMHAFLHVLGFHHEQVRTDRDDFVVINWANIPQVLEHNFVKRNGESSETRYDYNSVMHYGAYGFAYAPTIPTVIPLDESVVIGQRETLSAIDIERVQIHYGCIDPADSVHFKHLNS